MTQQTSEHDLETNANTAAARHVRMTPRKARMVINLIRDEHIYDALNTLEFTRKKAAPIIMDVLESALANVQEDDDLDWEVEDLTVAEAYVNEGPTMKRFQPRAMGRSTTIQKKTSHIHVTLEPEARD